jgi:hypothetical protein
MGRRIALVTGAATGRCALVASAVGHTLVVLPEASGGSALYHGDLYTYSGLFQG